MQSYWDALVESWPYGDRTLFVACCYVSYVTLISVVDVFSLVNYFYPENPIARLIAPWKIQPDGKVAPRLMKDAIIKTLVSRLVIGPLGAWFVVAPLSEWRGMSVRDPLPSFPIFVLHMAFCWLWNDFFFYWAHRLMHAVPYLYANVHATHHRFTTPCTLSSEFAHPVEHLLSNLIPTLGGALALGSHPVVLAAFLFLRMWESFDAHSGYAFPWSPFYLLDGWLTLGPRAHDWHHSHNRGMYGVGRHLDWLFGTDKLYMQHLAQLRSPPPKSD